MHTTPDSLPALVLVGSGLSALVAPVTAGQLRMYVVAVRIRSQQILQEVAKNLRTHWNSIWNYHNKAIIAYHQPSISLGYNLT